MAQRAKNMRLLLIEAGIEEINRVGVRDFSVRRVATSCGVSCAAPYKHFKDKREFIAAIIEYVNEQWQLRHEEIVSGCTGGLREKIVQIAVRYLQFLMENPGFRSILMMKDAEFDIIYQNPRAQMSACSLRLEADFFIESGWDQEKIKRKLHIVRSILYGTVFLIDSGELVYDESVLETVRNAVDREFDLL